MENVAKSAGLILAAISNRNSRWTVAEIRRSRSVTDFGAIPKNSAICSTVYSRMTAFMVERRLRRYRSLQDVQVLVDLLSAHDSGTQRLNNHELQRLLYVLKSIAPDKVNHPNIAKWVAWWNDSWTGLELVPADVARLGIQLKPKNDG